MGAKNSLSCKSFDFLDGGLVVEESLLLELLSRAPSTYLWRKTSFCRSFSYHFIGLIEAFDNIALEPNNTCARVLSPSCKSFDFLDGGLVVEELLLLELQESFCRGDPQNLDYKRFPSLSSWQQGSSTSTENLCAKYWSWPCLPWFGAEIRKWRQVLKLILVLNHRRPFLSTQSRKSFFELDLLRTIFSTLWIHFFE